jgi:hypothetical protein
MGAGGAEQGEWDEEYGPFVHGFLVRKLNTLVIIRHSPTAAPTRRGGIGRMQALGFAAANRETCLDALRRATLLTRRPK